MIEFEGFRVPDDFIRLSDGCTAAPDRLLGVNMTPACVYHDFLRRYGIVSVKNADRLFHRYLISLGQSRPVARFYWFMVKVTRPWFRKTEDLPSKWADFRVRRYPDGRVWIGKIE